MKQFLFIVIAIVLLGLIGRMDYQDAVSTAEYDRANKQAVLQQWEQRCSSGDIFDVDICKSFERN